MRYMGSKARHAKHIIPILMAGHDQSKPYVEPFVGGGNMIDKVPADIRWGSDVAEYAIALLQALSLGWVPPHSLSETEYHAIKKDPGAYAPELVGFAAYSCSFGGKFWGGYARNKPEEGEHSSIPGQQHRSLLKQAGGHTEVVKKAKTRDHPNEQHRALQKQAPGLRGVLFECTDYESLSIPEGSTIYCDPPYAGTTKYKGGFDHGPFWKWATEMSATCSVYVSEYTAPQWWTPVWEKQVPVLMAKDPGGKLNVEKLFKYRPPE